MSNGMKAKTYEFWTLAIFVLMAAPFCLPLAALGSEMRDYAHVSLLVAISALIALLWWAGVRRWGSSGALLSVAAAPVVLVVLLGAVLLDLWPTPEGSVGLFVFAFPAWVFTLGLISAFIVEKMERRPFTAQTI